MPSARPSPASSPPTSTPSTSSCSPRASWAWPRAPAATGCATTSTSPPKRSPAASPTSPTPACGASTGRRTGPLPRRTLTNNPGRASRRGMSRKAFGKVLAAAAAVLVAGGIVPLAARADRPPAAVDSAVTRAAAALTATGKPTSTLDVVVSLDQVADGGLRSRLLKVGTWAWAFHNLPLAGVRLSATRLDALRHVDGVKGVYLNTPLHYELKDSAKAMNVAHAWNDLHMTGKGVTVAILDSGVDGTHPDLAPAMKANVKLLEFGAPFPTVPLEGVPNSDTTSGHGTHVAGDVAGRGIKSDGDYKGMAP